MKYTVKTIRKTYTRDELLRDLKKIAEGFYQRGFSFPQYKQHGGQYSGGAFARHFGNWNNALGAVGLKPYQYQGVPAKELFKNMKMVWDCLERQPTSAEMKSPLSTYSVKTYVRTFGTWNNALERFGHWQASKDKKILEDFYDGKRKESQSHQAVPASLELKVWKRDNATCQKCKSSPANCPGVLMHIDHIIPRAKGGGNTLDNLQLLCARCNIRKSNRIV